MQRKAEYISGEKTQDCAATGRPEELVALAQGGDEAALLQLVSQFEPLVLSVARRYQDVSLEDAKQHGYLAIIDAIHGYDDSLGVPFAGYARMKVHGDVRTTMRKEWRHQGRMVYTRETDDEVESVGLAAEDKVAFINWRENPDGMVLRTEWLDLVKHAKLSPREALSIEGVLKGLSSTDIAKACNVSVETAKTWRKRAMRKLRAVVKMDGDE